jgi:hypothetical protein
VEWEFTFDNKSRCDSKKRIDGKEATEDKEPVSWPAFCLYLKQNFPKLVIQSPSEDICDDCVVYANRHKFVKGRRKRLVCTEEDNEKDDKEELALSAKEKKL